MNEEFKIKCPHCGKALSPKIFEDHFKKELEWMRKQPKARTTKSKSRIEDFKIIKEIYNG